MSQFKMEVGDRTYLLDSESITAHEYRVIQEHTGLGMRQFWTKVAGAELEITAVDGLRWLFLRRAGQDVSIADDYNAIEVIQSISAVPAKKDTDTEAPKAEGSTPTTTSPSGSNGSLPDATVISGN